MTARLPQLKQLLEAHGLRPRKRLGQNFLVDPNFARAVAAAAAPGEGTLVVEVGPGAGALTEALLAADPHARVLAVELDGGLARLLRSEFATAIDTGALTLLEGDVLDGKHALNPELVAAALRISRDERRPRRVLCANLPYNAATPLLANLALPLPASAGAPVDERLVEKAIATVQLELAERLLGAPGGADYGPLAALLALRARGRILRKVGPEVFWPRPQVHSAVVELEYRPWPSSRLRVDRALAFQAFVQRLFQQRRKTLHAILKKALPAADPRAPKRAEDMTPDELLALFEAQEG